MHFGTQCRNVTVVFYFTFLVTVLTMFIIPNTLTWIIFLTYFYLKWGRGYYHFPGNCREVWGTGGGGGGEFEGFNFYLNSHDHISLVA